MNSTESGRVAFRAERAFVDGELRPAVVLVDDGTIAALDGPVPPGCRVVEVPAGAVLLPGLVDTHVHINEPGRTAWEGFATATAAAAAAGVTTLLDMPLNSIPPTTSPEALDAKRAATAGKLAVDVGFWGGAVPENLGSLGPLVAAGVFGVKVFLSPPGCRSSAASTASSSSGRSPRSPPSAAGASCMPRTRGCSAGRGRWAGSTPTSPPAGRRPVNAARSRR